MAFARFMSGPIGRILRVLAGLALMLVGIAMQSTVGWIVAAVGLVPIAAGGLNLCLLAPLFGGPISGRSLSSR